MKRLRNFMAAALMALPCITSAQTLMVGEFSRSDLKDWQEKSFEGNTQYKLAPSAEGDTVLHALTHKGASGMFREIEVDLGKTPYLNWSWRVENIYSGNDEKRKAGDDFPARVYVVVSGGVLFWKTRAVNYVWSNSAAIGSHWPNPFTGNAIMLAVQSGNQNVGSWQHEKRNIRQDLQALFGEDIKKIDAVAIMSDSDNAGQKAAAQYGDIYFSAE